MTWCLSLAKSDAAANWANFWAFLSRAWIVTQHLKGSSKANPLKDRLRVLTNDAKGLEMCAINVEALVRSLNAEVSRL